MGVVAIYSTSPPSPPSKALVRELLLYNKILPTTTKAIIKYQKHRKHLTKCNFPGHGLMNHGHPHAAIQTFGLDDNLVYKYYK